MENRELRSAIADHVKRIKEIHEKLEGGGTLTKADIAFVSGKTGGAGRKVDLRRWTLEQAGAEFDINPRTLTKRVKTQGISPGDDGKFSTRQICAAVFGDLHGENLRKVRAEADILEMKRGEMERTLIPERLVEQQWEFIVVNLRQKIWHSAMPEDLKRECLSELQSIKVDEYFANQSREIETEEDPEPIGTPTEA